MESVSVSLCPLSAIAIDAAFDSCKPGIRCCALLHCHAHWCKIDVVQATRFARILPAFVVGEGGPFVSDSGMICLLVSERDGSAEEKNPIFRSGKIGPSSSFVTCSGRTMSARAGSDPLPTSLFALVASACLVAFPQDRSAVPLLIAVSAPHRHASVAAGRSRGEEGGVVAHDVAQLVGDGFPPCSATNASSLRSHSGDAESDTASLPRSRACACSRGRDLARLPR